MILKKHLVDDIASSSSATILGLKVVGGRITDCGRLGAIIDKVKKGSIADTIGRLRPGKLIAIELNWIEYFNINLYLILIDYFLGDEVLEWNGRSLQGKTYEEVYDIIAESKQEPQVELIVSRTTQKVPLVSNPKTNLLMKEGLLLSQNRIGRRHTDVMPQPFRTGIKFYLMFFQSFI